MTIDLNSYYLMNNLHKMLKMPPDRVFQRLKRVLLFAIYSVWMER